MTAISVQKVSDEKYRFLVDQDAKPIIIFTSKSFNMTEVGEEGHVIVNIDFCGLEKQLLIRFSDVDVAHSFYDFVCNNDCLDKNIDIVIPKKWSSLVPPVIVDPDLD